MPGVLETGNVNLVDDVWILFLTMSLQPLRQYASVDKYEESHGGFTFSHFKLRCA